MEVDIKSNTAGSPELTYVKPNEPVGSVLGGIDSKVEKPQEEDPAKVIRGLREQLNSLQARIDAPLMQRAQERGHANREKRKSGLGEFLKKVKGAFDKTSDTAEGLVAIGVENVKDPQWRAEQYRKVDDAISAAQERARQKAEANREKFWGGVDVLCNKAAGWVEGIGKEMVQDVKDVANSAVEIVGNKLVKPLLSEVVAPAVELVKEVDFEVAKARYDAREAVGKRIFDVTYDILSNTSNERHPILKVLENAARDSRNLNVHEKGLGKFITGIDSLVAKCRTEVLKLMASGIEIRNSAQDIRESFLKRNEARSSVIDDLNKVAAAVSSTTA